MNKRFILIPLSILVVIAFLSGSANDMQETVVVESNLEKFSVWQGDAYINSIRISPENKAFLESESGIFVALHVLQNCISDRFIYSWGNSWFVRQHRLEKIQVYEFEGNKYLYLNDFGKYLQLNKDYWAMGIILLQTNLPSRINWNGKNYTFTGEKAPTFDKKVDDITEDGRRMWFVHPDLWIEDDCGYIYRYKSIQYGL